MWATIVSSCRKEARKNSDFDGIWTHTFQLLDGSYYQLSYQATHWEPDDK